MLGREPPKKPSSLHIQQRDSITPDDPLSYKFYYKNPCVWLLMLINFMKLLMK